MNYRHAFHAGNFADVVKHLALVSILTYLKRKPAPFAVIDSHAGRGLYELTGEEARRGGEAAAGIGRVAGMTSGSETLSLYLDLARSWGAERYPGSPLIAAKLLREKDRLVAIEKHPEEFQALRAALAPFPRARAVEGDGYARLAALLPPAERRGVVLVDPPFEAPDEFAQAARAVGAALERFATGIVVVWFPIKSATAAASFCGEVLAAGARKALRLDIAVDKDEERLSAAGLLVINPPYGFESDMRTAVGEIALCLGGERPARFDTQWLAGSE